MNTGAWSRINERILRASVEALADEGFSGETMFRIDRRQLLRVVHELHPYVATERSPTAQQALVKDWQEIISWVAQHDFTVLHLWWQTGKLTKIQTHDRELESYDRNSRGDTNGRREL